MLRRIFRSGSQPGAGEHVEPDDGFHDPLAVEIGLGVSARDLPSEGWPDTFRPEVAREILRLLPEDE